MAISFTRPLTQSQAAAVVSFTPNWRRGPLHRNRHFRAAKHIGAGEPVLKSLAANVFIRELPDQRGDDIRQQARAWANSQKHLG
jgi:hypothetical protein